IMPGADNFNQQITHFYRCLRTNYFFEARGIIDGFRAKEKSGILTRALDELCADESGRNRTADLAGNEYVQLTKGSVSGLFYDARTRYLLRDHNSAFYELQDINIITAKMEASQEFRDYMTYRTALMFARLSDKVAASSRLQSISGWRANQEAVKIAVAENRYVTGQFDAYNALRDSILQYRGDRPDWLTDLGMVCIDPAIRLYADAEKYFQQALKIDSTYVPAFEGYVSLFAVQKQYDKALAVCDRYPFFGNFYPHLAITRAVYLAYTNRVADARQLFESRIPSDKGDLTEFDRFLDALDARNATEDARATVDLMVRLNPDNADALAKAASIALDARNYQEGLNLIDRALTAEPSFGLLKAMRAQALYGLGKRDEAFKVFEEILAKDDSDVEACLQFSHILASEKIDSVRAENMAMSAFNYEHSLRTQMNACYVYMQFGRYDLARGEALKAIGNFPNSPEPLFYVGLAMSKEGNPEFKKNLEKAVAMGLKGEDLDTAKAILKNG
ncbi:MAG TPA: tetratricopeptide repeat protein, partial [Candidatus Acidoferrum sp.]|nr:tetratricopeptide repeat protein [Candidatus Acidoferrum sp.]